jgi:large subunit ribosomal protein L25
MSTATSLIAETRENAGTGPARELRRQGRVPGIIYGAGKSPMSVSVEEKEITKLYRKKHFISTVIDLQIGGDTHKVLPKAIDLHPVKDTVNHFDFVYLESKTQKMEVPVVFDGKEKSLGVKRGGFFNIIKRTITVLAPSNDIPRNVTVDVTNMYIGQTIKASSLTLPEGCKLFDKKDFILASITGRGGKAQAEDEKAEEGAATAAPAKVAATK